EKELAALREKATGLRARWQKEREAITRLADLKKKVEALRFEAEEQTRLGNLERAAQIQYGELPRLEAELKQLNAAQDGNANAQRMLKEEVDEHPGFEDARRRSEEARPDGATPARTCRWSG